MKTFIFVLKSLATFAGNTWLTASSLTIIAITDIKEVAPHLRLSVLILIVIGFVASLYVLWQNWKHFLQLLEGQARGEHEKTTE